MSSVTEVQKQIKSFFTVRARHLAKETFAIQRERKFNGSSLLQTFVFGWLQHPDSSVERLASQATIAHVHVSDAAIDKHFTPETATFLQACLQELTQIVVRAEQPVDLPLLTRFPQIVYEDSSIVSLPEELACIWKSYGGRKSATQAGLKLHVCFDLRTGQLWGPAITDGKHNDHHSPFRDQGLPKGSLKCSDLGYFDAHLVKERQEQGIFTLGRVHTTVKLFDLNKHPLRIEEIAPQQVGQGREQEVLMGGRVRVKVRLLMVRVPLSVEQERQHAIREDARERQVPVSEQALKLARWTILFTDVPADQLSIKD